mmetsp:Transcript_10401/g.20938  ORF Transcript_10401/g.20938 Transcript_10401/m.20938 type:complete len:140 (-) Transcript_10401:102-521(-)
MNTDVKDMYSSSTDEEGDDTPTSTPPTSKLSVGASRDNRKITRDRGIGRTRDKEEDAETKSDDNSEDDEVLDDAYIEQEMGDMIRRAAQWLTDQDNAPPTASQGRGGSGRGRGLPTKRGMLGTGGGGRGVGLSKRARLR